MQEWVVNMLSKTNSLFFFHSPWVAFSSKYIIYKKYNFNTSHSHEIKNNIYLINADRISIFKFQNIPFILVFSLPWNLLASINGWLYMYVIKHVGLNNSSLECIYRYEFWNRNKRSINSWGILIQLFFLCKLVIWKIFYCFFFSLDGWSKNSILSWSA